MSDERALKRQYWRGQCEALADLHTFLTEEAARQFMACNDSAARSMRDLVPVVKRRADRAARELAELEKEDPK